MKIYIYLFWWFVGQIGLPFTALCNSSSYLIAANESEVSPIQRKYLTSKLKNKVDCVKTQRIAAWKPANEQGQKSQILWPEVY